MNVLWFSFSLITAEPWHRSLPSARIVPYYDKITRPPGLLSVPPDREMLDIARSAKPDIILFCGIADWNRLPQAATFSELRHIAPCVLLSGDLSDPPWWSYLEHFRATKCFDLVVNFDGNRNWPKGERDLDLLTPIAHEFYPVSKELKDRLIPFGFCGGCASPSRWAIIGYLVDKAGLQIKPREETYGTYDRYARFMMECAITINVPFSGSDNSRQVKGRVLESGLARTCLLDHVSSASKNWFTPGVDYIEYESAAQAAQIVRELQSDWPRAQAVADSLNRRVKGEHSPEKFWTRIFDAVGVK